MPFFIPCRCASNLGEFAVYSGSPPGLAVASRMKYGFDSQIVQTGSATAGTGVANQAARGPRDSYLANLAGGGNSNVEEYNRTTEVRTVVVAPWGATPGQPNCAGPLDITQSSMFHRNSGFTYFPTEVVWATNAYNTLGSFLPGATFAANVSGCVFKNDKAHLAGEGSTNSNTKWLYDRQLGSFNVNGTIVQAGAGFICLSGVNNGYYAGGQAGGLPFNTTVRLVYQTGLSVFTTALVSGRGQAYGAWNATQTTGIYFGGGVNNPGGLAVDALCIRFLFATEANAYSSFLPIQATNSAGA